MPATAPPRFLFVPVSGPGGAGEYYRSLAIARGLENRWPGCDIRFVLNREAPYAADAPYPALLVGDSPTRATAAVVEHIGRMRPDVAIFDSAGRQAQFSAARAVGARVVYISSRPSIRAKGFRIRRMRVLDQHWIVSPEFASGGEPTAFERLKWRLARGPELLFLQVMHEAVDPAKTQGLQQRLGVMAQHYVVFCPGGGGTFTPGTDPARVFLSAAQQLAVSRHDVDVVAIIGRRLFDAVDSADQRPRLHLLPSLPNGELLGLIGDSRVAAVNGGSLLIQSMAQRTPLVAAPIAGDQQPRIMQCAEGGYVRPVTLDAHALFDSVTSLLDDAPARDRLRSCLSELALRNGVDIAVDAVARLLARP